MESLMIGTTNSERPNRTKRRIEYFFNKFGQPHLDLACHAAFPLALTPDLLYQLWAYFRTDRFGRSLNVPWIAVSDLLLSDLCIEVDEELYEMDIHLRSTLLQELEFDQRFQQGRLRDLSFFLLNYVNKGASNTYQAIGDLVTVQNWTALAYIQPSNVAREIALALKKSIEQNDLAEQLRLASIAESLSEPLSSFQPLIQYAKDRSAMVRRRDVGKTIPSSSNPQATLNVADVELPPITELSRSIRPALSQDLVENPPRDHEGFDNDPIGGQRDVEGQLKGEDGDGASISDGGFIEVDSKPFDFEESNSSIASPDQITIPSRLLNAIYSGDCILFIGPGIAKEADVGIPDSTELARELAAECASRDSTFNFNQNQNTALETIAETYERMMNRIEPGKGRVRLEEFLDQRIPGPAVPLPKSGVSSYPFIVNIPWQPDDFHGPIIVTTNWDWLLEQACVNYAQRPYVRVKAQGAQGLLHEANSLIKLIKLHGSINPPENLIVTTSDYSNSIGAISVPFSLESQLAQFMATKTMLFVGYSLSDSNLSHMVNWVRKAVGEKNVNRLPLHYIVNGETVPPEVEKYFENRGFHLIHLKARPFFRELYTETNEFINRDEKRDLSFVQRYSLGTITGPAGVGKSYLLRRIANDIEKGRPDKRAYKHVLLYPFPSKDPLSPLNRCIHLLRKAAEKIGKYVPDIDTLARERATTENRSEDEIRWEIIQAEAKKLTVDLFVNTLLLFDSTGTVPSQVLQVIEFLSAPAVRGSNLKVIFASRNKPAWNPSPAARMFNGNTHTLAPFHEKDVSKWLRFQAVLEGDMPLEIGSARHAANLIIRVTRGHPEAIKLVFKKISLLPELWRNGSMLVQYLQQNQKLFLDEILEDGVKEKMLDGMDDVLKRLFVDALCIFRTFATNTIDAFARRMPGSPLAEAVENRKSIILIKTLREQNLASDIPWERSYLNLDPVVRGLLAYHMELSSPTTFLLLNQNALDAWQEKIETLSSPYQHLAITECLYHGIFVYRATSSDVTEAYASFEEYFGKLIKYINPYPSESGYRDYFAQLYALIENDDVFRQDFSASFSETFHQDFLNLILYYSENPHASL